MVGVIEAVFQGYQCQSHVLGNLNMPCPGCFQLKNLGDLTLKDEDKEEECGAQQGAFVRETRNWGSRNCESGRTGGTLSNTRANSNACREEDCGRGKRATSP